MYVLFYTIPIPHTQIFQVAWGYLLPVGMCGALNVGIKDTWLHKKNSLKSGSMDLVPEDSENESDKGNEMNEKNRNKNNRNLNNGRAKRLARMKRNEEEGGNSGDENEENDDVGDGVGGETLEPKNSRSHYGDRDRDKEGTERDNDDDKNDDDGNDDSDDKSGASKGEG